MFSQPYISKVAMATAAKNWKDLHKKNNFATQSRLISREKFQRRPHLKGESLESLISLSPLYFIIHIS